MREHDKKAARMRAQHIYEENVRAAFESMLTELSLNGRHLPAENPFDWQVIGALEKIAAAHLNATDELISDARRVLDRQLHRWPARTRRLAA